MRAAKHFLFICLFFVLSIVSAQDITRVVVLPFDADETVEAYGLGLATGVQRSLNVIDNVYVPAVGDAFLYTTKLVEENRVDVLTIASAFEADVILSGTVTAQGSIAQILLGFAGPAFPEIKDVLVTANLDNPDDMLAQVVNTVVAELALGVSSADRAELTAAFAQMPSVPSLGPVAEASLRLPALSLSNLATAAQLDAGSSWVLSEYARALALSGNLSDAAVFAAQAVAAAPSDVEAQVIQAIVLRSSSDDAGAAEAFNRALALNPAHALALTGRGVLTGSAADLQTALNAYPRQVDAYLEIASLEQAAGDDQRALQTLRQGSGKVPEATSLHRAFIATALRLGDPNGALAYLQAAVAAQTVPPSSLYSLAAALPAELNAEALTLVEEGQARYPQNLDLVLAESDIYALNGDAATAESVLQTAFNANPQNVQVANELAILQAQQGKLDAARATLEAAQGESSTLQLNLGQLYLEAGQNEAALSVLEPLANAAPGDAVLQANYGVALSRAGRNDEALAALDRALAANPDLTEAANAKALIEQRQGLGGQVEVKLSPEATAAFDEGQTALQAEDYGAAAAAFSRAYALQPDGLVAFYQGYAYYLAGQSRTALPAFERALETFPDSDVVLNNLGLVQLELGRLDLALDYLNRAVAVNADNADAQLSLGQTYFELGNYTSAVSFWERAVALKPELEGAIAKRLGEARSRLGQ